MKIMGVPPLIKGVNMHRYWPDWDLEMSLSDKSNR